MDVATILEPGSVCCEAEVGSKKHALEILSQILADAAGNLKAGAILDGLAARERLGSTGLGSSVAMPHARLGGIDRMVGGFLRLTKPVSFDSTDGEPVDLLFGLLVPAGSAAADLKEIRELVKKLRDPDLQRALRAAEDAAALYELLTDGLGVTRPNPIQKKRGG
jgi:PTS system nitrogen regulatory IIA component